MRVNNKKLSFFALCLLMALTCMSSEGFAQRDRVSRGSGADLCSSEDTKVVVKLATAKTKYYKNYNARTINAIHNSSSGGTILGLAGGPIEITTRAQYNIRTRNGKSCVHLDGIEVLFWAKPVIVIASNFKEGSCEYREVFAHEQRHVRTTRKFLRQFAPKLRKEVREIIKTTRTHAVVSQSKVDKAQESIQRPIETRLAAFQNKIFPILRSRQAEIDTPEEYARVAAQCDNWGKKLANGG